MGRHVCMYICGYLRHWLESINIQPMELKTESSPYKLEKPEDAIDTRLSRHNDTLIFVGLCVNYFKS